MEQVKVKYEFQRLRKKDLDFLLYTCLSWPPRSDIITVFRYWDLAKPSRKGSLRVPILYDPGCF